MKALVNREFGGPLILEDVPVQKQRDFRPETGRKP